MTKDQEKAFAEQFNAAVEIAMSESNRIAKQAALNAVRRDIDSFCVVAKRFDSKFDVKEFLKLCGE